jgi:hypothetical protein
MNRKFQIKAVPSTWLENDDRRLDCGPYMSGAVEAKELLKKHITEPLKNLTAGYNGGIFNGPRFPRVYVEDPAKGVPFLGSTDILDADLSFVSLLSKKQVEGNPALLLDQGWTLITCSGTIGRMAFARSDMRGMAGSQHFMRVSPDIEKIRPGYLYAYLSSRFGVPIVVSGTYGAIIQHIEPHHIADLPVPRLGEVENLAHNLIQKAAMLRVEAALAIREGTRRFLAATNIEDIPPHEWLQNSGQLGFVASISKTVLRAVNYIPLNIKLAEIVRTTSPACKTLADVTEPGTLRSGLRFKRIDCDPEYGVELIGQREISAHVPNGRWIAKNKLPKDKLIFVPEGTILVNAQGGLNESDSYARCQFISGKKLRYAYSQHFLRVIADENEIPRGALFAYLRSNIAFRLLRSCAIGSMQQDFHPELIRELPVPIISDAEVKVVDGLVRGAYKKYDEAIDCEDQARTLVERTIEEGAR